MLQKHFTGYCDGCGDDKPLLGQTVKDCTSELVNQGWTVDNDKHIYCPRCSQNRANNS